MHWNGLEELKASQAYQRAMSGTADTGRTQSGWRGRGGHDNRGGRGPTLHVVSGETDDNTAAPSSEGQSQSGEGQSSDQQLSVAPGNSQRGGRGGRGGRGRGGRVGAMAQWTDLQKERYDKGLCLECGEKGHYARQCPKAKGE